MSEDLKKQGGLASNPVVTSIRNAFGGAPSAPAPTPAPAPTASAGTGSFSSNMTAAINRRLGKDDRPHLAGSPEDGAHDAVEAKYKVLKDKLKELKDKNKKRLKDHVKSAEKEPRSAKNRKVGEGSLKKTETLIKNALGQWRLVKTEHEDEPAGVTVEFNDGSSKSFDGPTAARSHLLANDYHNKTGGDVWHHITVPNKTAKLVVHSQSSKPKRRRTDQ